jgi:hypothetical protein
MGESRATQAAELSALRLALDLGYRAFDTAEMYADGAAESLLGEALAAALGASLRREELFVVSKVYPHHASAKGVVALRAQPQRCDWSTSICTCCTGVVAALRDTAGLRKAAAARTDPPLGRQQFDVDDLLALFAVPAAPAPPIRCGIRRRSVASSSTCCPGKAAAHATDGLFADRPGRAVTPPRWPRWQRSGVTPHSWRWLGAAPAGRDSDTRHLTGRLRENWQAPRWR